MLWYAPKANTIYSVHNIMTPESTAPRRHRLNDERKAITHKFQVGVHEGYLTVGLYDDTRQPGEIFLKTVVSDMQQIRVLT